LWWASLPDKKIKTGPRVNLQNAIGSWPDQVETCDFVLTQPIQRSRFSQRIVCHLLVVIEAVLTAALAALMLANNNFGDGDVRFAITAGFAIGAVVLLTMFISGGATYDRFTSRLSMLIAALAGASLMMAALTIGGAKSVIAVAGSSALFSAIILAKIVSILVKRFLEERGHLTRLVAVAADDLKQRVALIELLRRRPDIELVFAGAPSHFETLSTLTQANQLDEIVLSGHQANEENIAALAGLAVTIVRVTPQDRLELNPFDPVWGKKQVFGAWSAPASVITLPPLRGWRGAMKRTIDIVGAAVAIILLSPVLLFCALAVKMESRGPALFVQERAGYRNKPFRMYKFRSMSDAKADLTGSQLTLRNDPRVTKVGAFLRRTSLDELPQLFNVLRGDMSLVGPRPHPKGAKAGTVLYDDLIPHFYSRYRMKPGITGLAQVSGLRGNTETEQHLIDRFGRDLQYASEWTPILDIAIMLRTVTHLFKGTNAF
jgi:exopolysaccharide biosynthesis polyprenyl glycosylphosphotransferase